MTQKKTSFYNNILLLVAVLSSLLTGCIREENMNNSPQGNFDTLWKLLDEHYCYFDYKDIDWNQIYDDYSQRISPNMSKESLFEVLGDMTRELQDGHVNLFSAFGNASYWEWYEDYPRNFEESIIEKYLGKSTEYHRAGGLQYKILEDNIGYIYYASFMNPISHDNISHALRYLALCDGLIIDIRNNGGGNVTNSTRFASHFIEKETTTGFIMHKKGKGHNDFSKPFPITIKPANGFRWQKSVVLLTNRRTYSAANDFTNNMNYSPNVTIMGDKTGGGGGLPFSSELPNGWGVRFSASPQLNASKEHIEFGIEPDIKVDMQALDIMSGIDTIIEKARLFLKK